MGAQKQQGEGSLLGNAVQCRALPEQGTCEKPSERKAVPARNQGVQLLGRGG